MALGASLFASLAFVQEDGPVLFDRELLLALEAARSDGLNALIAFITDVGSALGAGAIVLIVGALLWRKRALPELAFLVFAALGGAANEALKYVFGRPRPHFATPLRALESLSFPSGHSAGSVALYGALFLVIGRIWPARRRYALPLLLMPPLIGLTRPYLGVHYPTDVLAGWGLGAIWLGACHLLLRWRTSSPGA